jgi:hypothetical protein
VDSDIEDKIWDEANTADFLTLRPREAGVDVATDMLNGFLLDAYHWIWGKRHKVRDLRLNKSANVALLKPSRNPLNGSLSWKSSSKIFEHTIASES